MLQMMMTWQLIIFLPFLGTLLGSTPKHLKLGALSAQLGEVALIEDVLMVKYSFAPLLMVPVQLKIVVTNLNTTRDVLHKSLEQESFSPTHYYSFSILQLLTDRIGYLNDKLNKAQQYYNHISGNTNT